MKNRVYYGAAIAAFVIWGFIPFPLRAMSEFASGQILYFRMIFALVLLLLINGVFRRDALQQTYQLFRASPGAVQKKSLVFAVLGGILLAANWLIFIYVLNHVSIQTASFSYLICPIMTALLGFFILKEPLRPNQWVALGLSVLSCYLIGVTSLVNLLFSLLIASSYAFYLLTQRLVKQYDKMVLLNLQIAIAFTLIGPFYFYLKGPVAPNASFYGSILLLSVLFTIIPLFLNLYALNELKSGTIGILMYINPLINFSVAFLYYGEKASAPQQIAYVLIGLSVVIYNLNIQFQRQKQLS